VLDIILFCRAHGFGLLSVFAVCLFLCSAVKSEVRSNDRCGLQSYHVLK
jgi:hypothetical protein